MEILHDLRSSVRSLSRKPFYPLAAVSILAIGLSAGIAVFTYANGFFQPFPGADADGLVRIYGVENDDVYQDISFLDFEDYAEAAASGGALQALAAGQTNYAASVRLEDRTEVAFLEAVTGRYFSVLGIEVALGRGILPEDDRPGAESVAVLAHDWWQNGFNADRRVLGRTIYLNYRPFTVVGVMPADFVGATADRRPHVWIPIEPFRDRYTRWAGMAEDRDIPLVRVYGRLREGSSRRRAEEELNAVAAGLDEAYPSRDVPRQVRLDNATWISPRARLAEMPTVRLMIAAAAGLLLLVCANVANLLLAVALRRGREMSVRAALGASPGRLVRHLLIENLLLSGAAGAIALLVAVPATTRLGSYFARPSVWGENVARQASLDLRVVLFALVVSVLTGLLAGLLPALRASRQDLLPRLRGSGSEVSSAPRRMLGWRMPGVQDLLVATQVALSVVLLVASGLVLRTLSTAGSLDPGFDYDRLVVTHISTSSTDLEPEQRERFFRELAQELEHEPWVESATVADYPPLSPHPAAELRLEGKSDPVRLTYSRVHPGFFQSLGIEVRRGRAFHLTDRSGAPDVAIVNQKLADRFFAGQEPIGRRIWWPTVPGRSGGRNDDAGAASERQYEIVGVVSNAKFRDFFSQPEPMVYTSYPQHPYPTGSALLVTMRPGPAAPNSAAAVPLLHRWLRGYEAHLAIVNVIPYTEVVAGFLYTYRMNAELFSLLAVLGLGLSTVGIFGVGSLAVSRRLHEIGIRMAIGAKRREIRRLVLSRAALPVALGLGAGLAATLASASLLQSLLFGVEATDPLTLAAGSFLLVAAALAAAYLPARRAASTDPVIALRRE
ncbi:MAG TPA: ADOP family duplicated permease [Acidobacteriota bacterium]|nr:ADOP family duplicated permease [Acidobacteriota bacterium]